MLYRAGHDIDQAGMARENLPDAVLCAQRSAHVCVLRAQALQEIALGSEQQKAGCAALGDVEGPSIGRECQAGPVAEEHCNRGGPFHLGVDALERLRDRGAFSAELLHQGRDDLGVHLRATHEIPIALPQVLIIDDDAVVNRYGTSGNDRLVVALDAVNAVGDEPRVTNHGKRPNEIGICMLDIFDASPQEQVIRSGLYHSGRRFRPLEDPESGSRANRQTGGLLATRFG
jgi:hypothetical protein